MNEIPILHEDEDIIIINKPTGVIVNKSQTHTSYTVQDFLLDNYKENYLYINTKIEVSEKDVSSEIHDKNDEYIDEKDLDTNEFYEKTGIIHRIDKDTSGVLVIAKNPASYSYIKNQFKQRQVNKEYLALTLGHSKHEKMKIDAPLKRNPKHPLKFAVVQDGKNAVTDVEKVKEYVIENDTYTLFRIFPKTGRTHQIRVHLSAINHPIAADSIYLSKIIYQKTFNLFGRLMLHARALSFVHPTTKNTVNFVAPIPKEFNLI